MAFKIPASTTVSLESPETLFRDIKVKRIAGPLADQADLWRAYVKGAANEKDVALQLPTGGGKTLVGLMLGEWRRRKFSERVVYLCPTKQLAYQVADQATRNYGLDVVALTGSHRKYSNADVTSYHAAEKIAVTTYSSVFNSFPFFDNAGCLILDDAHAAEQYISSAWSIEIDPRNAEHRAAYEAIVAILSRDLPPQSYARMTDEEEARRDRSWVDKIPTPTFSLLADQILAALDVTTRDTDLAFSWKLLRDHLLACHCYIAPGRILIRPLIPPTYSHAAFTSPNQRIYMSATFGEAGELERITARSKISRLQVGNTWDRQTIGRRYFLFPERSLSSEEQDDLLVALIAKANRALVLTPDDARANDVRALVEDRLGYELFDAKAIEKSKEQFVTSNKAVAVISNRYDGIDFPENECRLESIEGLPRATNLQEQFLILRLGASDLLRVRINTRIVQAFGRCTRSDNDYSAVVVRGEELTKHLLAPENRAALHPELQGELTFGIEQSKEATISTYLDNARIFFEQGKDWRNANDYIVSLRDSVQRAPVEGSADLESAVQHEIEYQTAMWGGDYVRAYDAATKVLGQLKSARLRGYRAYWHYLAGSAAHLASSQLGANLSARASEQFSAAARAERTISWIAALAAGEPTTDEPHATDFEAISNVERIESVFDKYGSLTDHKYAKREAEIRGLISNNSASEFEEGHRLLGEMLGFSSGNSSESGAPDPWWKSTETFCFVFEDYSDATGKDIPVSKARQAATHGNWVRANGICLESADVHQVLITPVLATEKAAVPHLKDVLLWQLDGFRTWAEIALRVLREIRAEYPRPGDLAWRALAIQRLTSSSLSPRGLLEHLRRLNV